MKELSSVNESAAKAIDEIVDQLEKVVIDLIGHDPEEAEVVEKGRILSKPNGNQVYTWEGVPLVEYTQFQHHNASDIEGEKVRGVLGFTILKETEPTS